MAGTRRKKLTELILPAQEGVKRVVHILAPKLQDRLAKGDTQPCVAIRSSETDFKQIMLVREAELLGRGKVEEWFDHPLPGTNGRGVLPLVTSHAVRVWYEGDVPQIMVVE